MYIKKAIYFNITIAFFLLSFLLFKIENSSTAIAFSPIINIQSHLREDQDKNPAIQMGGKVQRYRSGANQYYSLAPFFNFYCQYRDTYYLFSRTEFAQAFSNEAVFIESFFEHIRPQIRLYSKWLFAESFFQYSHSGGRRIQNRFVSGIGPRFLIFDRFHKKTEKRLFQRSYVDSYNYGKKVERVHDSGELNKLETQNEIVRRFRLAMGLAYMYEYLRYDLDRRYLDAGEKQYNHRVSTYLDLNVKSSPFFTFITTLYYQPRLNRFRDYNILGDLAVELRISKYFTIVFGGGVAYTRYPPQGIRSTSYSLDLSLRVQNFSL